MIEDETVGWHHRLNLHEFEQAPGVDDGQGSLACCSPWGCKELDTTDRLNHNSVCKVSIMFYGCTCAKSVQSCMTLCNSMDCSPPGSSVHGILQARILERVAISFSRRPSWPRDRTLVSHVFCIGRWVLYISTTWKAPSYLVLLNGSFLLNTMRFKDCLCCDLSEKEPEVGSPVSVRGLYGALGCSSGNSCSSFKVAKMHVVLAQSLLLFRHPSHPLYKKKTGIGWCGVQVLVF